MKTLCAFLFTCFPFSFFAQTDNYCPCQETQSDYEVLFEWSVHLQERAEPVNLPQQFHQPPPSVMQEPVIVPVSVQEEKIQEKEQDEIEPNIDESRINIAPEKTRSASSNASARIKKKTKRFKGRVKKRKKAKKYKGKCPAF